MEGYGRGGRGRGRNDRESGGGGRGRGRGRGRGGGSSGSAGGGNGRGDQRGQYHQQHQQPPQIYHHQQHQQPHFQQPWQGNQWAQGPNSGRGGSGWGPNTAGSGGSGSGPSSVGRGQASSPVTAIVQPPLGGGSYAAMLRRSSGTCRPDPGAIVPKVQSLNISEQSSLSAVVQDLVPIMRPDNGGSAKIRTVNVLVNHFPVTFNPETVIRHYDIDIKPALAPTSGRPVKISKSNLSLIMDKLLSDHPSFPLDMIAYDGEKNVFSATPLPTGQFTVEFSDDEDMRCRSYNFSVNLVNELKLHKLKDYLTGNLLQIPRDVLQGMDVVMKENPRRHMISIGRSFHPKDSDENPDNRLGFGLSASRGIQHSLKPTSQGLALCLDYSVLAVRQRLPVLQFLEEHVRGFSLDGFRRMRKPIESALKGLKVTVIHRLTKQKYVVSGLTDQRACDISFTKEDPDGQRPATTVRLVDYFVEKYNRRIQHGDLPCLNLGKGRQANYVPIELCVLVEGQRYPKDNLDRDSALLLKNMSLAPPQERQSRICGMLQSENGPCGGEICKNFEIDVRMNMTGVKARVIRPPQLKLKDLNGYVSSVTVEREGCQWNLIRNAVVEGTSLQRWAVLDFSHDEKYDRLNNSFIPKLVTRCRKLGLDMDQPLFVEPSRMSVLCSVDSVTRLLETVNVKANGDLQLLLCVMTRKDSGYKNIKWISETKIGIITQCCLSKMANKGQDQYLANFGMKINSKLGGSNAELVNCPIFEGESDVMLIGADVNHPSPMDLSSPSIAAVVASMNWPAATKYSPRVSFQQRRSEKIIGFGEICLELIESYEKLNGVKPKKIIIFRDGVSEGQFDMVLNEELLDLKMAMQKRAYCPTITLIVAQKRHQTRLFPETFRDGGSKGNVPPGTVVDQTIVHPFEFDFYLCSHTGSIGTSKPTHYHVLWDEHNFSSDKMQEFIYSLCFTFARCCKPVSLVPPVYYADLLAYRGRLYHDAQAEQLLSSRSSSSSRMASSSSSSGGLFDESIFRLHSGLQDSMIFI